MEPKAISQEQARESVRAAQAENLALVVEFPGAEVIIVKADQLQEEQGGRFRLGAAASFDLCAATHVRAVDPSTVRAHMESTRQETFHDENKQRHAPGR